ncbi:iron ABC transporter substrate-binding protein [Methanolacinia paynteri]|uniref:iron ABC transporter substrate-binding protein n=1 Tax=Methanolacinia paynteri TaxID=230356 RepID=UPI00064FFCC6|nr:iron ABC transporter substrate-binding protein [Methanolacinia paynteri]
MSKKIVILSVLLVLMAVTAFFAGCTGTDSTAGETTGGSAVSETITITDSLGRGVTVPKNPESVVCSGSGTLRLLVYLEAQDKIVGVDDIEIEEQQLEGRPYAIANPQLKNYPLIGEYRGADDPEKIIACNPQVIFKSNPTSASEIDELQDKTGIPVVALTYGSLSVERSDLYQSLTIMGEVMGKEDRAKDVIEFFNSSIADLNTRTESVAEDDKISTYVGGISYRGPHGFQSTEPSYPPFVFVNAYNVAGEMGTEHADVAKEKIIEWNPEVLFVDLGTLQTTPSAIDELKTDESYQTPDAVKSDKVYGVLPYNYYSSNYGSVLADAYYVGSVLYPDQFADINPAEKADEIYTFLVGEPVFDELNAYYDNLGFTQIKL